MRATGPVALPRYDFAEEPPGPNDRDALNSDAIIRFIRLGWRLCLVWILAGVGGGLLFVLLATSYYTASTTILLEDRTARSADAGGAGPADPAYADSQIQILQSDEVVGRVVDQNRLTEVDEFGKASGLRALASRLLALVNLGPSAVAPSARYETIIRVRRALFVGRVGASNAVDIAFTSRVPARSAAIAAAIAKSYIDGQLELKREARQRRYLTSIDDVFSGGTRVIVAADLPAERSWPRTLLVLAFAAVGGALGGIGHALFRQVTDRSLRSVEDVRHSATIDCIAAFPKIEERSWQFEETRHAGLQTAYVKSSAGLYDPIGKIAVRLQWGRGHRSRSMIGVIAPTDGAGTSSIAAHLARIIAESGQKTLLVDANWRKSAVAQPMLNAQSGRKLARALASIDLEPEKLDVLVLRATEPISELNASLSIVATLQHQQAEYECVVVDFHCAEQTGDLEASVATMSDVIVVAEARRTSSESLRDLLRLVPKDKIVAVILNKM